MKRCKQIAPLRHESLKIVKQEERETKLYRTIPRYKDGRADDLLTSVSLWIRKPYWYIDWRAELVTKGHPAIQGLRGHFLLTQVSLWMRKNHENQKNYESKAMKRCKQIASQRHERRKIAKREERETKLYGEFRVCSSLHTAEQNALPKVSKCILLCGESVEEPWELKN